MLVNRGFEMGNPQRPVSKPVTVKRKPAAPSTVQLAKKGPSPPAPPVPSNPTVPSRLLSDVPIIPPAARREVTAAQLANKRPPPAPPVPSHSAIPSGLSPQVPITPQTAARPASALTRQQGQPETGKGGYMNPTGRVPPAQPPPEPAQREADNPAMYFFTRDRKGQKMSFNISGIKDPSEQAMARKHFESLRPGKHFEPMRSASNLDQVYDFYNEPDEPVDPVDPVDPRGYVPSRD